MNRNRQDHRQAKPLRVAIVESDERRARALAHAASLVLTPTPTLVPKAALREMADDTGADVVLVTRVSDADRSTVARLSRESTLIVLADADEATARRLVGWGVQDVLPFASIETEAFGRAVRLGAVRSARERDLRRAALIDEITGLYNRRGFLLVAQERLAGLLRRRTPGLLAFLDLDDMKGINDRRGHEAGDRALGRLAEALRRSFRSSDVLARVGGDEFAAFAEDAGRSDTLLMEARLRHRLASSGADPLDVSIGWAVFDPDRPASLQELLGEADRTMYVAKRRSRFRVV